jgi:hypothetical protein
MRRLYGMSRTAGRSVDVVPQLTVWPTHVRHAKCLRLCRRFGDGSKNSFAHIRQHGLDVLGIRIGDPQIEHHL